MKEKTRTDKEKERSCEEDLALLRKQQNEIVEEISMFRKTENNLNESPALLALINRKHSIDKRIKVVQQALKKIKNADFSEEFVSPGDTVVLKCIYSDGSEEEIIRKLVSCDPDPIADEISPDCDLGKAIYKRKVGDRVKVVTATGSYDVIIVK